MGEVKKGFRQVRGLAGGIAPAQGQRVARHLFRILKFTESGVNIADGAFEVRLDQRLVGEILRDSRRRCGSSRSRSKVVSRSWASFGSMPRSMSSRKRAVWELLAASRSARRRACLSFASDQVEIPRPRKSAAITAAAAANPTLWRRTVF